MLRIEIVNDGTANTPDNIAHPINGEPFCLIGNYNYKVYINLDLISEGRISGHNRLTGWQGLLSCLDKEVNSDRFRD